MTRRRLGSWMGTVGLLASAVGACGCTEAEPPALEPPMLPTLRLDVDGPRLVDALGREVILRGVNAGGRSKIPPFVPFPFVESGLADQSADPPFDTALQAYVAKIAEWGHDAVRLPFTWEAVEPERGSYDETYLARYFALVASLQRLGVRVIVDFHQDVFARPLCGDGFPLWALPDPSMEPREGCADTWHSGYFGDAEVDAAFDRFWQNEDGLRDEFEAMWRVMAERGSGFDNVVGYDVMNEPHGGAADSEAWARDVLTPFYSRMTDVLREVAPDALVFVEPSGVDTVDGATVLPRPTEDRVVFEMHYYSAAVFLLGPETTAYDTDADLQPWAELRSQWQLPILVGELGSKTGTEGGARYMEANLESLDRYLLHGTAWEYSTTRDDWNDEGMSITRYGGEETPSARALVRAYPRAVAGRITAFTYDAAARTGLLQYDATAGTSEIVAPARLFPEGVDASLEGPAGRAEWNAARGLLLVETSEPGLATVRFAPAP